MLLSLVLCFFNLNCTKKEIIESQKWSLDNYFTLIKESQVYNKYKDITFFNVSRDSSGIFKLILDDKILTVTLFKDYTYEIQYYQENLYDKSDIPDTVYYILEKVINDCKLYKLFGLVIKAEFARIYFLLENIYIESLPKEVKMVGLKNNNIVSFTYVYNQSNAPRVFNENEKVYKLDDNWYFTINKLLLGHFE